MICWIKGLFLGGFLLILPFFSFAATLKVVTFNILAPPWASLDGYPDSAAPFIDRIYRRGVIINNLNQLKDSTDVISLQETTPVEFGYISAALKDFTGFQVTHDPEYWSNYITEDPPWEPNGVAILVKKSVFKNIAFSDQALSESGNHGAFMTAVHKATNKKVRIVSVHLDSDHGGNRNKEMGAALELVPLPSTSIDMIVGDFNSNPEQGNYAVDLTSLGFKDVLDAIGNNEATHPYAASYNSNSHYRDIDHIVVRNAIPGSGDVVDYNLYSLYPVVPGNLYEDQRITANMQMTGSDHFLVWGLVKF